MNCSIKINPNSVISEIISSMTDTNSKLSIYGKCVKYNSDGNEIPTDEYAEWYNKNYPNNSINFYPKTEEDKDVQINRVKEYLQHLQPTLTFTKNNILNTFYSEQDLAEIKRKCIGDCFCEFLANNAIPQSLEAYRLFLLNEIKNRLQHDIDRIKLDVNLEDPYIDIIDRINSLDNINKSDLRIIKNSVALYFELKEVKYKYKNTILSKQEYNKLNDEVKANYKPYNKFMTDLSKDKNLKTVIDRQNKEIEVKDLDDMVSDNDGVVKDNTQLDTSVEDFEHSGLKRDALEHISADVKGILSTIPMLNSIESKIFEDGTTDYDYKPSDSLGDIMYMDYQLVFTELFNNGPYNGVEDFLESLSNIASKKQECRGFKYLYDLCKNDPSETLLNILWQTFGKPVISKITIVQSENGLKIQNNKNNSVENLLKNYFNTSVKNGIKYNKFKRNHYNIWLNADNRRLQTYANAIKNQDNDILTQFIKDLRTFFGEDYITPQIIKLYVNEATTTVDDIETLIKEFKGAINVLTSNNPDNFFTQNNSLYNHLIKVVKPYTVTHTEYNSTNAEGNQTSDIINASFLTRLRDIFNSEELLLNFRDTRLKAHLQTKYSNILVGDNTKSNTLFYLKDNKYELTENATNLLDIELYNGITNYEYDKSATYNHHAKGDYIRAILEMYNTFKIDNNEKEAKYFLRIPSDAKNNYVVKFRKTSGKGLFIGNIPSIDIEDKPITNKPKQQQYIDDDTFINKFVEYNIDPNKQISLNLSNSKNIKDGESVIIAYKVKRLIKKSDEINGTYTTVDDNPPTIYIEGTVTDGVLTGSIIGNANISKDINISNTIKHRFKQQLDLKGNIKRTVNTKHSLFKQLDKQIRQELLDIADNINFLFETNSEGLIVCDKENSDDIERKVKLKDGKLIDINSFNAEDIDGCCASYHHIKGKLVEKDKDGIIRFVGNGFKSNKFIVTTIDENGQEIVRNFGQEFIDKHFNLLYGGADNNFLKVIKDKNGKLIDIAYTEELEKAIEEFISEYIIELSKDTLIRLNEFNDIVKDENVDFEKAAEIALNYQIFYGVCDELFEGDTKYYKSIGDLLKRAKEVQGSGLPYGDTDLRRCFNFTISQNNIEEFKEQSTNANEDIIIEDDNGDILTTIKNYKYYSGVTIYNTRATSNQTLEVLEDKLHKDGKLDENTINDLLAPYKEITINDAQSYITVEEWIRRLHKRGLLLKHEDLIKKILKGEDLNAKELTTFAQVQKNFYYDHYYDKATGRFRPRQIKNAEFVLIPQLIKGTELEVVYNLMKKHNIDQLNTEETSKASKTNILKIFDRKTGVLDQDIIKEINNPNSGIESEFTKQLVKKPNAKEIFQYEFLYTQQDTPQHMDSRNKASIQIMKKIIDNINEYSSEELQRFKQDYLSTYSINIKDSAFKLFKDLNILAEDGKLNVEIDGDDLIIKGLDYNKINSYLESEKHRRDLNNNILDYIEYDPNTGETKMPNYMTIIGDRVENMTQAIFNSNITRQTLPGFHAAQISSVGLKTLAGDKSQIGYSDKLQYHTDKNNYVSYVEVMLPKSAFNFGKEDLKHLDGETEKEYNDKLLKLLEDRDLDKFIGYRIPTEGKQSICVMKVKGFISDGYGSTIVVPNEWVGQTGSDFDIDSVYAITKPTYINNEGTISTYDGYKEEDITKLNRQERETRLVTNMLNILEHDESLVECLSSSNFKKITEARDFIYEECSLTSHARRKGRSGYNFLDQADSHEDAMGGAILKGFSVSRDNLCSVCNTVKPILTQPITVTYTIVKDGKPKKPNEIYKSKVKDIENRFNRAGVENVKVNGDKLIVTHDMFGWTNDNKNICDNILTIYSSQTTAHILDAIKEGFITNVNDYTFGVYKLFPDIGSDYFTAIAFIAQPGISDIIKENNKINSVFINKHGNPIYAAIRALAKEIDPSISEYANINDCRYIIQSYTGYKVDDNINLSYDELIDDLKFYEQNKNKDLTLPENDEIRKRIIHDKIKTIDQFKYLYDIADKINKVNQVTNPDKFGAKQTIDATNNVMESIIRNIQSTNPILVSRDDANVNFLSEIYPGLDTDSDLDIDYIILDYINNSDDSKSKHQILHSFLKYSTAPSIIINRQLFPTQTAVFRRFINRLNEYLPNNKRLTEKELKNFKQYFISYIYTQCNIIATPYTYDLHKTAKHLQPHLNSEKNLETQKTEEFKRILGYGEVHDITTWVDEVDNDETIIDKKQAKLNRFAELSPAQKIEYIKTKFDDSNTIFNYIIPIVNPDKNIHGTIAQKLVFNDGILNENDVLNEIENIFNAPIDNKNNPYCVLAILDLVKYSFVVEQYKMIKRGISKMIPNSILYNSLNKGGIGLVDDLNSKFANIDVLFNTADSDINPVFVNYIRSHHKKLGFKTHYIKNNELEVLNSGMIYIPLHTEDENLYAEQLELLNKYNIVNSEGELNYFVKLNIKKSTLYRIKEVPSKDCVILYPLNLLEENEHGTFSANSENNVYPQIAYYETFIDKYETYDDSNIKFTQADTDKISELKYSDYKSTISSKPKIKKVINDKLNNPKHNVDIANEIINKLSDFYNNPNNLKERYFLRVRNMFSVVGNSYENLVLLKDNNGNEKILPLRIEQIKPKIALTIQSKYLHKNEEGEYPNIPTTYKNYTNLINELRSQGIKTLVEEKIIDGKKQYRYIDTPIYIVTNVATNNIRKSSVSESFSNVVSAEDVMNDLFNTIKADLTNNSTEYAKTFERSITTNERNVQNLNVDTLDHVETKFILKHAADYITERVNDIINKCTNFYEDEENLILTIDDDKVIDLISDNRTSDLAKKFYSLIFAPKAIIRRNQSILSLAVDEQDPELKEYFKQIHDTINKLENNSVIKNAIYKYAQSFIKESTNPLIKQGIINIINSFYSVNYIESHIGSIADTPDTLIQVLTKYIDDYIFTQQKTAEEKSRKVADEMNAIINNNHIDWSHIIDPMGKFIKEFIPEIKDVYNNLISQRTKDINDYLSYIENEDYDKEIAFNKFKKYVETVHELNKFRYNYLQQEVVDDYYKEQLELDTYMLKHHNKMFITYKELTFKLNKLYEQKQLVEDNDNIDNKIVEIRNIIKSLRSRTIGAESELKPIYDLENDNDIDKWDALPEDKKFKSYESADALDNYIKNIEKLENKYKEKNPKDEFIQSLEYHLNIISRYNELKRKGSPINNQLQAEFEVANLWISRNASQTLSGNIKTEIDDAFDIITRNTKKSSESENIISKAKDIYGVVDGTRLSPNLQKKIKNSEELQNITANQGLIKTRSNSDNIIYSKEFYNKLRINGINNEDYINTVQEINAIIRPYYNAETKVIEFDKIPDTEEGLNTLRELISLYNILKNTKKKLGTRRKNVKDVIDFIEENVDVEIPESSITAYNQMRKNIDGRSDKYIKLFERLNIMKTNKGANTQLNSLIYGNIKPKKEVLEQYIDKDRTKAFETLNKVYEYKETEYYKKELLRRQSVPADEKIDNETYNEWFERNHIYDERTGKFRPTKIWMTYEVKAEYKPDVTWEPKWFNVSKQIKAEYKNSFYSKNGGLDLNYRTKDHKLKHKNNEGKRFRYDTNIITDQTKYDNPIFANQTEIERNMRVYLQNLMYKFVKSEEGVRLLDKGYAPMMFRPQTETIKDIVKDFGRLFGVVTSNTGKDYWHDEINFDTKFPEVPFLQLLSQTKINIEKPIRGEDESLEDYNKRYEKYEKDLKEANKANEEAHKAVLNNDWLKVFPEFIKAVMNHNALEDVKGVYFLGKEMIKTQENLIQKYGLYGDFKKDRSDSTDEKTVYKKKHNDNLLEQYNTYGNRLFFNEFKESNGLFTRIGSILQNMTSAKYMMLNVRGGIANITLGTTQVFAEVFAHQYFDYKDYAKANANFATSIIPTFANLGKATSTNKYEAIIKFFDVIDVNEQLGKSILAQTPNKKAIGMLSKILYSPQTIGEHALHNTVLLSILESHRVFKTEYGIEIMNLNDYLINNDVETLKQYLADKPDFLNEYNNFIKDVKSDENKLKRYAWYYGDVVNDFAKRFLSLKQIDEFIKLKEERKANKKEEFYKAPTVESQLTIGENGFMTFVKDSLLDEYNNDNNDSLKALAKIRNRTVSINDKMHGYYRKIIQAQIEKKWWGGLLMQYHKHLYPGMLKRFRVKGIYSEQRGTIEKGYYVSALQFFIGTPIKEIKKLNELTEVQVMSLQGMQNIFRGIYNSIISFKVNYKLLPDYEKQNMLRLFGDIGGLVFAYICLMILKGFDNDEYEDKIWYNLALYEADRLANESMQFNPRYAFDNLKKLWATPVAAQSSVEDLLASMELVSSWLFDENYDPTYKTGRFAGENKFKAKLLNNIPIVRQWWSLSDLKRNNSYYKVGENALNNPMLNEVVEWIDDDYEDDDE